MYVGRYARVYVWCLYTRTCRASVRVCGWAKAYVRTRECVIV